MNLTPKEREKKMAKTPPTKRQVKVDKLKEFQLPLLKAIGAENKLYSPKMAYNWGDSGICMGFYKSELESGDIYAEKIDINVDSEDSSRTLYKIKKNSYYNDEYSSKPKSAKEDRKWFIPVEEMEIVSRDILKVKPKSAKIQTVETNKDDVYNLQSNNDLPMSEMTMKDFLAIMTKSPISNKSWLNELIKSIK